MRHASNPTAAYNSATLSLIEWEYQNTNYVAKVNVVQLIVTSKEDF